MNKRFVLCTLGTRGDLYPFLSLAQKLMKQGHTACIATHKEYQSECENSGANFLEIGPSLSVLDQLWQHMDKNDSLKHIMKILNSSLDFNFQQLMNYEFDFLINHPFGFVSPIAARIKEKPWISVALTPFGLFSAFEPPVLPQIPGFKNPLQNKPWLYRPLMKMADFLHKPLAAPVPELYKKNNLPLPNQNPIALGQFSPFGTWALFDPEFGKPQADWPKNTQVLGFPFWQMASNSMKKSDAKIVVGFGSSWPLLKDLEIQSLVQILLMQSLPVLILGASQTEKIRRLLPKESQIQVYPEENYSKILKDADIFIHSGGIGAVAEGIRNRNWQIIVPLVNDQFDNAKRVEKLGWGECVWRKDLKKISFNPRPLPQLKLCNFDQADLKWPLPAD